MASRAYRGGTAKIYFEAAWDDGEDIAGSPSWTIMERFIDVSVQVTVSEAAVPSRESNFMKRVPGLLDLRVTGNYRLRNLADTIFDNLVTEMTSQTQILLAVMSTAIATSGSKGWQAPVYVLELGEEQPLEDGASASISFVVGDAVDASDVEINPTRLVTA